MKNLVQESFKKYNFLMIILFLAVSVGFIAVSGNMKLLEFFFLGCLTILIIVKPFFGLLFSIPLVMYFAYIYFFRISVWNYLSAFLIYLCILVLKKNPLLFKYNFYYFFLSAFSRFN